MSSQNIDIEEPFIDDSINEDYTTKGAFNAIYNLVINQSDDQDNTQDPQTKTVTSFLPNESDYDREVQPSHPNVLFSRNEDENFAEQTKAMTNIHKSREIHRQLINRKNRWKPSEIELAILKLHFGKNKYPSKEEKETILRNLEKNFNSTIQMGQLNRWFQHEREKSLKNGYKNASKNSYKKFGKEELEYLKENFTKNNYPKTEEMTQTAKRFGVSLSKIENWYKHNRRALAKKGDFILKTKKYFKRDEVNYLLKMFAERPRPTKEEITEMSECLNCSELQIKNWYSNKRKKQKIVAKKQATETQEIQLHQNQGSIFPQIPPQSYDPFTNSSINPINSFASTAPIQGNDSNGFVPNMVPIRPINNFPVQQLPVSYANGAIANNQYFAGMNPNGMYPNGTMPVIIIPAASLNPSQTLNGNNNGFFQTQDPQQQQQPIIFRNDLPKNMQSINNPAPSPARTTIPQSMGPFPNVFQNLGNMKQNNFNLNNSDMSNGNWMNQNSAFQSSNPMIFVQGNKPQGFQNPQMAFTMQNQTSNFAPVNMNSTGFNTGTFASAPFTQNAGNMQGVASHEPPMQIQYLTNLYCPYSNNNIFSTYYPVVLQNGSNFSMQNDGKPVFGMGNGMPSNMVSNPQQMSNNMGAFIPGAFREGENSNDQRVFLSKN